MSLRYLIIGNGYVGQYLFEKLAPNAELVSGHIYDMGILKQLLLTEYPSHTLINAAGKTGKPNVDWCEDNKDVTFGANVGLPVMIAETCKQLGKCWVHIGSGCVYDGYEKEWCEEDAPNFDKSFYSKTKAWSQRILSEYPECLILRIRMPIDEKLQERSYVAKVIKYAKEGKPMYDMENSVTFLPDMVNALKYLTEKGSTGTFNVVNKGSLKADDVIRAYQKYSGERWRYKLAPLERVLETLKAGRSNCVLSASKLSLEGFDMPDARGQLDLILREALSKKK